MASTRRKSEETESKMKRSAPATTPEARERHLVSLATDEAEIQIREGRASSQLLTHFVKLGSTRESLEQERLRNENELLRKKVEALESAVRIEELYEGAINAMRGYQGEEPLEDDYED